MLQLDDPRWYSLEHASGFAGEIPVLLKQLKEEATNRTWDKLWDELLVDMEVYPATIAVIPHLVAMAHNLAPDKRYNHLIFVGMVAAHADDSAIPDDLEATYHDALNQAVVPLLESVRVPPMDERIVIHLLASLAAVRGNHGLGRILACLIRNEFGLICPHCESGLYVAYSESGFHIHAPEPGEHDQHMVEVEPCGEINRTISLAPENLVAANAHLWLPALAMRAGYPGLAERIHLLHGNSSCPFCGHPIRLANQITRTVPG